MVPKQVWDVALFQLVSHFCFLLSEIAHRSSLVTHHSSLIAHHSSKIIPRPSGTPLKGGRASVVPKQVWDVALFQLVSHFCFLLSEIAHRSSLVTHHSSLIAHHSSKIIPRPSGTPLKGGRRARPWLIAGHSSLIPYALCLMPFIPHRSLEIASVVPPSQ